jgi:predicted aldo/keto reductase-like oxidoreductase
MMKAKDEGLIRHVGLTSHSLDILERVIQDGLFETVMVCYSFLEPAAEEKVIPLAREKNIGVIAMKPFSGGFIEDAALALKFTLSQPDILVIPGVESKALFDRNWEIFTEGRYELTGAERSSILDIRSRADKVFCRRCDYCQPCSEDIPIQLILGIRSLIKRMGESLFQREWIVQAIEKARNCSRCEECMSRCPYSLPIPDLIQENLEWLDRETAAL